MKWLNSRWFEKLFLGVCYALLIWFTLGFIFVGGYIFLLMIEELQSLWK